MRGALAPKRDTCRGDANVSTKETLPTAASLGLALVTKEYGNHGNVTGNCKLRFDVGNYEVGNYGNISGSCKHGVGFVAKGYGNQGNVTDSRNLGVDFHGRSIRQCLVKERRSR